MRIVVTGATGLLGNNVVRAALDQGIEVVAVARRASKSPALQGLNVAMADVDITDWSSLERAISGHIDAVIHCAAHIHLGWEQLDESMRINVDGSRNALRLAEALRVRCVYISSVNVLPVGPDKAVVDEKTPGDGQVPCTYVVTKRAAEAEARQAIDRGADVVIIYPGFMVGPWDWRPSSGEMILGLANGAPPMAPSGGCSVCDPRDVAHGVLTALRSAPRGERYIMAGENWSYFQLWTEITSRLKTRPPWFLMQKSGRWTIGMIGDVVNAITGKEPVFNSAAIRMSAQFHWYSSKHAEASLGYVSRPASESIQDAIDWFREQGKLA